VLEAASVARGPGVTQADIDTLVERGFISLSGSKLQRPNRLLARFLDDQPDGSNAIARLFGTSDAYDRHLKEVLMRRVQQIPNLEPTLKRYLERAADDLPDHPEVFLSNVRGMVNHAFELVWSAELEQKRIPSGWMSIWKSNEERGIDDWHTSFPQGGQRLRLLKLMTGTDRSARCSKHITRTTYVLMEAANSFGDFGQHQDGAPVTPGVGYAAWQACIELAASLARDLARNTS
jgi:hypothetical protein